MIIIEVIYSILCLTGSMTAKQKREAYARLENEKNALIMHWTSDQIFMNHIIFMYNYINSFFKQKTAYEIPKRDWSSDVCSSDLFAILSISAFISTSAVISVISVISIVLIVIVPPVTISILTGR